MATILISHCERNLGRVENHLGSKGSPGETLGGELGIREEW